jgi:hypothetical protein
MVACLDILMASPGSTNTCAGLQQILILLFVSADSNGDTKSESKRQSLIFLNQCHELTTSSEGKVACNNFVM